MRVSGYCRALQKQTWLPCCCCQKMRRASCGVTCKAVQHRQRPKQRHDMTLKSGRRSQSLKQRSLVMQRTQAPLRKRCPLGHTAVLQLRHPSMHLAQMRTKLSEQPLQKWKQLFLWQQQVPLGGMQPSANFQAQLMHSIMSTLLGQAMLHMPQLYSTGSMAKEVQLHCWDSQMVLVLHKQQIRQ